MDTSSNDKDDQSTTQSTQQSLKITLKTILEDPEGFELFARHLAREFAIENLLFYLESAQWLLSFGDLTAFKNDDKYQQVWCGNIKFPENAPQSRIVNSTQRMAEVLPVLDGASSSVKVDVNGMIVRKSELKYKDNKDSVLVEIEMDDHTTKMNIKDDPSTPDTIHEEKSIANENESVDYDHSYYLQSVRLFRKYIANDSYFCINVSSKVRSNLYHLLGYNDNDKINEEDLVEHLKQNLKKNEERNNGDGQGLEKEPNMIRTRSKSHHNDKNIEDLFHIFDIPRAETFQLMNYAVSRFKHTKRYKAWIASKKQKK
eukprot:CAMPEP_0201578170 /NCGR_PEP_ID=MMETSP0190_2-20130828/24932_1 /ASSEMBLY_ACC=CAM_ASM_000263 /TAXON_ID=37353 /ORGANISM="Rosalina sp." /LENGTH=314 /DNA_ID=CAMNT_0048011059 /DNA_START=948 /DNA_END=1892 /DNA_ORIENTATION=+